MRQGTVAKKITCVSGRPFVVVVLVLLVFGVAIFASACGDESTASGTAGEGGTAGEKARERVARYSWPRPPVSRPLSQR